MEPGSVAVMSSSQNQDADSAFRLHISLVLHLAKMLTSYFLVCNCSDQRALLVLSQRVTKEIISSESWPLYFPGNTLSKEKLRMSLPPDRATVLLSPCRLTGCRVTERSSQDARGQPEDVRSACVWETNISCFLSRHHLFMCSPYLKMLHLKTGQAIYNRLLT